MLAILPYISKFILITPVWALGQVGEISLSHDYFSFSVTIFAHALSVNDTSNFLMLFDLLGVSPGRLHS